MDPDRFVLTSVEVRHFKSIQGSVQLRIPKKASLLAVVGPNGAGVHFSTRTRWNGSAGGWALKGPAAREVNRRFAGKTVCLEAIAFATGAQPQHLRCKSLTDLLSTNGQPEVQVVWSTFSGKQLVVSVVLKSTNDRCATGDVCRKPILAPSGLRTDITWQRCVITSDLVAYRSSAFLSCNNSVILLVR